jgi:hypothetical protein
MPVRLLWAGTGRFIARSKIVLNLHAYERSPLEIVRLQLLFANRKCVLTETCAPDDPEYNLYRGCMAEGGNAAQLAAVAQEPAGRSRRFRLGQLGHDAFKSRPQALPNARLGWQLGHEPLLRFKPMSARKFSNAIQRSQTVIPLPP